MTDEDIKPVISDEDEPNQKPPKKPISRKLLAGSTAVVGVGHIAVILQYYAQMPEEVAMAIASLIAGAMGFLVGFLVREDT